MRTEMLVSFCGRVDRGRMQKTGNCRMLALAPFRFRASSQSGERRACWPRRSRIESGVMLLRAQVCGGQHCLHQK